MHVPTNVDMVAVGDDDDVDNENGIDRMAAHRRFHGEWKGEAVYALLCATIRQHKAERSAAPYSALYAAAFELLAECRFEWNMCERNPSGTQAFGARYSGHGISAARVR